MFSLTTNIVENSYIDTKILYILLKTVLNQTSNTFNTELWRQWKDRKSSYPVTEAFDLFDNLIALTLD